MSLAKTALKGGLWSASIRYPAFIINFICNLVLSRILVPESFGIYALATSLAEIIFLIGNLGFARACVQIQDDEAVFDTGLILTWLWSLVILLVASGMGYLLSLFYQPLVILIFLCLCAAKAIKLSASIYLGYLDKKFAFKQSALADGLSSIGSIAVTVLLASLSFGVWSLVARELIMVVMLHLLAYALSDFRFRAYFTKHTAKRILRFSFNVAFIAISDQAVLQLPKFILGTFASMPLLASYERGIYLANLNLRIFEQFYSQVGLPLFSQSQEDWNKISKGLNWNLFGILRIMTPITLAILLYPKFIFTTLLGSQWQFGSLYFQGLALFIFFKALNIIMKTVMLSINHGIQGTISAIIQLFCVIIGLVVGYSTHLWLIVPWSLSLGALSAFLYYCYQCYNNHIALVWRETFSMPVLATFTTLVIYGLCQYWQLSALLGLILLAANWLAMSWLLERATYYHAWRLLRN